MRPMNWMKRTASRYTLIVAGALLWCLLAACAAPETVSTPTQVFTPAGAAPPSATSPRPDPPPTDTPASSRTPAPSDTPAATATAAHVPPTATLTASATGLPVGGSVRYGFTDPDFTFDPVQAQTPAERQAIRLVWESLFSINPTDGSLSPGLAHAWTVSADGMTVTCELLQDVRWSDDKPFTAADVVATFQYLTAPDSLSPWQLNLHEINDVTALDPYRVQFALSEPACSTLYDIGSFPILPAHQLSGPSDGQPLAGAGPFRFDGAMDDAGAIALQRNPDYRSGAILDQVILTPFTSVAALHEAWQAGEVDVAHIPAGAPRQLTAGEPAQALAYPGEQYLLAVFNLRRGILMDDMVREALGLALDPGAIAAQVHPAGATVLTTTLLPTHWAIAGAGLSRPASDPVAAGDLLTEAGWTDEDGDGVRSKWGSALSLDVIANGENPLRVSTASLVAQAFRQVGVESELHVVEWGIYLDLLFRHDFDVAIMSWPFPLDPDQRVFWHSSQTEAGSGFNFGQWSDERVDALLDQAGALAGCDIAGRADLYGEFARLMSETYPLVPLFVPSDQVWARPGVLAIDPSAFAGPLWNAGAWRVTHAN